MGIKERKRRGCHLPKPLFTKPKSCQLGFLSLRHFVIIATNLIIVKIQYEHRKVITMARTKDIALIHGAAFYFAYISRDKKKIANHFSVSERTIERWSKEPEWHQALDAWGYTGDRNFTRQPRRDIAYNSRERFDQAKAIYIQALRAGEPEHKLATITSESTGLQPSTIRRWAKRYKWHTYFQESDTADTEIVEFIGISKTTYPFETHSLGTEFPGIGAVYMFTRGTQSGSGIIHEPLYIGETEPLEGSFCDREKFNCVRQHGGDFICIHREADEYLRRKIESDLIAALNPICNER